MRLICFFVPIKEFFEWIWIVFFIGLLNVFDMAALPAFIYQCLERVCGLGSRRQKKSAV